MAPRRTPSTSGARLARSASCSRCHRSSAGITRWFETIVASATAETTAMLAAALSPPTNTSSASTG